MPIPLEKRSFECVRLLDDRIEIGTAESFTTLTGQYASALERLIYDPTPARPEEFRAIFGESKTWYKKADHMMNIVNLYLTDHKIHKNPHEESFAYVMLTLTPPTSTIAYEDLSVHDTDVQMGTEVIPLTKPHRNALTLLISNPNIPFSSPEINTYALDHSDRMISARSRIGLRSLSKLINEHCTRAHIKREETAESVYYTLTTQA